MRQRLLLCAASRRRPAVFKMEKEKRQGEARGVIDQVKCQESRVKSRLNHPPPPPLLETRLSDSQHVSGGGGHKGGRSRGTVKLCVARAWSHEGGDAAASAGCGGVERACVRDWKPAGARRVRRSTSMPHVCLSTAPTLWRQPEPVNQTRTLSKFALVPVRELTEIPRYEGAKKAV